MADFTMKANDTKVDLTVQLRREGAVLDLTGASVQFHMRQKGSATLKVDAAATVDDASTGLVSYAWQAADVDSEGLYEAEFEVTYADSSIETFPNDGYLLVKLVEDLA